MAVVGRKPIPSEKIKVRNNFYLDKDLHDRVFEFAKKKGVTKTRIIEEALEEYLERHKEEV